MARILLVDDDENILHAIGAFLEKNGHSVQLCSDPTTAVGLAEKMAADLAIIDYEMPRLTGTQLLALLRAGKITSSLPVLFLSGTQPLNYIFEVRPDSRVRFLSKPVNFDEFKGAIAALLNPEGGSAKT